MDKFTARNRIKAFFDREYKTDMLKSPDHYIFLSALINLQKMIYLLMCRYFKIKYIPSEPEKFKIWPLKTDIQMHGMIRKKNNLTPLILMGYYNVVYHFGIDNFINSCERVGIDGLIIVDLQPEEDSELLEKIKSKNIDLIRLVTPTTDENRLKTILKNASGFLYYVTITGITGQHSAQIDQLHKSILKVKKSTNLPVVAGFGIKNATQAKEICSFSEGVVIGSSIVKIIEENLEKNEDLILPLVSKFIVDLKKGITK